MCVCVCMCVCVSNIQSASEDSGCGLFVYRIYQEYHINLCECSMYGYCMEDLAYAQIGMGRFTETTCSCFLTFLTPYCFDPLCPRLRI